MTRSPAPVPPASVLTSSPDKPHLVLRQSMRETALRRRMTDGHRTVRAVAVATLGLVVGVAGTVLGVSLVQANDGADMYEVVRHDDRQRRSRTAAHHAPVSVYASHGGTASAYAPSRPLAPPPLSVFNARGQLVIPNFNLNPFHPSDGKRAQRRARPQDQRHRRNETDFGLNVVSGAAGSTRTICVRLCDGYHHPIGFLADSADMAAHEALCRATFPGVPTRVFRVAAGADTIDEAVSSDGRTYRALPMAYAYQTSIDPACARPRRGEQTVSIFRDFTLRPGDTVVTNGRPQVFIGARTYPYTAANFRDFSRTNQISREHRSVIDQRLGISRQEQLRREARRVARVREANAATAVDVVRGGTEIAGSRTGAAVRVIDLPRRTP